MKRRTVIRNVAASSLLVAGVGSAAALSRGSGSGRYEVRKDGGTFEVAQTPDGGGVGAENHCTEWAEDDSDVCCKIYCSNCATEYTSCHICYCHITCEEEPGCDEDQEN